MSNRERVIELFKKNHTAYAIHLETGIGIKEVYNYVRESEELKMRHAKLITIRKKEFNNVSN